MALGAGYLNSLNNESAEKVLSTAAHDLQTAAGANLYLGSIANRQGRYPEAVRHLDLALQAHPDYPDAYAELGVIYLRQRESALAQQAPEKALARSPNSYVANFSLTIV
jgi:Flp pilus assembly protein TadD